jgi:hypothetical protein
MHFDRSPDNFLCQILLRVHADSQLLLALCSLYLCGELFICSGPIAHQGTDILAAYGALDVAIVPVIEH